MDAVLLLARLVLAAVFAVAGVAKLADRAGSRQAMRDFGLPERLAVPAGIALPVVELAVAVLLLSRATAWWGALASVLLLAAFVAGIGYNLAHGRTPDCHCFGQLHSEPAGWPTLARNAVLGLIGLFIVLAGFGDPGYSVVAWLGDLSAAELALVALNLATVAAIAIGGWLLAHLLRQQGRLLVRLDELETRFAGGGTAVPPASADVPSAGGLPVGSLAPAFSLSGLHGETLTLDALRAGGKPVLMIFTDPNCGPCNALLPDLGRWQREHAAAFTLAVLSSGTAEANRAKAAEHGLTRVLLQPDRAVSQAFQVHGTPMAVVVGQDGTIGSAPAAGADAIRNLVARLVGESNAPGLAALAAAAAMAGGNGVAPPSPVRAAVPAPAPSSPTPPPAVNAASDTAGAGGSPPSDPEPATSERREAPAIELPDLDGNVVRLADYRGEPTLVLFWNPGCGYCRRMLGDLTAWEAAPPAGAPRLLVVSTGGVEANREQGLRSPVVLDPEFATGRAFGATGTPSAVLIDAEGDIASGVAVGAPDVLALANGADPATVATAPVAEPPPPKIPIGEAAPEIRLPALGGGTVDLAEFRGTDTLVVFWNPGCSYCAQMLDKLRAWEAAPPPGAPKLVVVSRGSEEAHDGLELRAPVGLDDGFQTGRAFGATGTPAGVLIDARGNVASDVALGANQVLALAGYVSPGCTSCLEECTARGGGQACQSLCELSGQCP